jgi:hypothetical protein
MASRSRRAGEITSRPLPARLAPVFGKENVLGRNDRMGLCHASADAAGGFQRICSALLSPQMKSRAGSFSWHEKVDAPVARAIDLEGLSVSREPKFLAENLVIFSEAGKGPRYLFVFARPHAALVEQIVQDLNRRLSEPALQEDVTADSASTVG